MVWLTIMCQRRVITCSKCTTLVGDTDYGEAMCVWRQEVYGESLYFQFFCELKTALNNIFKIIRHAWEQMELQPGLEGKLLLLFFLRGLKQASQKNTLEQKKTVVIHQNYDCSPSQNEEKYITE